jgi:DNA-binding FrmR family transcriptional regulator
MSKLLDDPKVAALVEKQVAAAVKAEKKRTAEVVKTHLAEAKNLGEKAAKGAATNSLKAVLADLKA